MAFGGTMCTEADIEMKEGANVSAAVTEAMHTAWALQAESWVNVTTHFNWTDSYSTLNADVKHLLTDAVSSKVAMLGINYDMSGYTSRVEAETMLDVLRDTVVKAIELLKEQNNKIFMEQA